MGIDLLAPFGGDLSFTGAADPLTVGNPTADFNFIQDRSELIQRIIHRLLTPQGEWIPFPNYGAGLRRHVNATLTQELVRQIKSDIVNQVLQESEVSPVPPPTVTLQAIPSGIYVRILFFTALQEPVSFAFDPSTPNTYVASAPGRID